MPAGMQVFDEQGRLMWDTTSIIGRIVAIIDANTANGSANIAGLDKGTPFAIPQLQQGNQQLTNTNTYPVCSFSANGVTWTRDTYPIGQALPPCKLIIGVR